MMVWYRRREKEREREIFIHERDQMEVRVRVTRNFQKLLPLLLLTELLTIRRGRPWTIVARSTVKKSSIKVSASLCNSPTPPSPHFVEVNGAALSIDRDTTLCRPRILKSVSLAFQTNPIRSFRGRNGENASLSQTQQQTRAIPRRNSSN